MENRLRLEDAMILMPSADKIKEMTNERIAMDLIQFAICFNADMAALVFMLEKTREFEEMMKLATHAQAEKDKAIQEANAALYAPHPKPEKSIDPQVKECMEKLNQELAHLQDSIAQLDDRIRADDTVLNQINNVWNMTWRQPRMQQAVLEAGAALAQQAAQPGFRDAQGNPVDQKVVANLAANIVPQNPLVAYAAYAGSVAQLGDGGLPEPTPTSAKAIIGHGSFVNELNQHASVCSNGEAIPFNAFALLAAVRRNNLLGKAHVIVMDATTSSASLVAALVTGISAANDRGAAVAERQQMQSRAARMQEVMALLQKNGVSALSAARDYLPKAASTAPTPTPYKQS